MRKFNMNLVFCRIYWSLKGLIAGRESALKPYIENWIPILQAIGFAITGLNEGIIYTQCRMTFAQSGMKIEVR